ncbi:D-alanyl-D-alanine carboxypeptidase family protein [Sphingomonas adhaesiva]|uniref:D-alanyl-D-alanine carboxypeptidase family protein n=1 Tax=Sphingomonas adhaesiva TaxID=28212 RepID=UPI002FFC58A6
MAAAARRDLYLQVGGNVTGLATAMRTGRTLVHDFGTSAVNVLDEVERKFGEVGTSAAPGLKDVERAYDATFKRIRENARAVVEAPSGQAALQIVDANATREAADAAEQKARAFRLVAEAATKADQAQNGQNAAVRAYAVAAAAAAVEAQQESNALREQATILGQVEGHLENTGAAHRKATAISGQARAGYQQLSYQLGDVATQYASGASASLIFAQQSGQVMQAVQLITGEAKGLLGVLTGPWGIALSSALVVLTPWVGKMLEGADAIGTEIEKLTENASKAADAAKAKEAFARTEAGAIDDVRQLTEELDRQNDALKTNAERLNIRAKNRLELLESTRADVAAQAADARAAANAPVSTGGVAGTSAATQRALEAKAQELEARVARIDTALGLARSAVLRTRASLADESAQRAVDPLEQIRRRYEGPDGLIEQAKKRAVAEKLVTSELTKQITALRTREKAELDRAQRQQSAGSRTGNNNQVGREITVAEATAIARSIGGSVTSGLRSREKQEQLYADKLAGRHLGPVAKPGTSDHERGQAIDISFAPGLTVAKIREAFAKEGVAIRQLLVERDQKVFHVAFGPKGKSRETIDRQEEAQAQKVARDEEAFAQLKLRAQEELSGAFRRRVTTTAEAADLEVQAVVLERQRLDSAAQAGVVQGRWTQAKADELKALYAGAAAYKVAQVRDAQAAEEARRALDIQRQDTDGAIALLQIQADVAVTAAERRRIALEILDHEERLARATLQAAINAEKDPARRGALERQLGNVTPVFAGQREQVVRQTEGPMAAYKRRLQETTADTTAALEGIAVRGFGAIEDAASSAVGGAVSELLGLQGTAGQVVSSIIADFTRLAAQKAIFSLIGGGGFFGLKDGGQVPGYADGGQPYLDGTSIIRGPGTGRSDSILALVNGHKPIRVSNGEAIVNERGVRKHWALIDAINKDRLPTFADGGMMSAVPVLPSVRRAANDVAAGGAGAGGQLTVRVALSEDLHATIDNRAAGVAVQVVRGAAPEIIDTARAATLATMGRPSL